ncbi:TIP41-like family-domain-containing protein [Lipomyces arxii]|uniref:TIP41-like family-domain-containing protein n=1 Tax=Lipomyces arxii TaxID=56418 RepID=UPI0034CD77D7
MSRVRVSRSISESGVVNREGCRTKAHQEQQNMERRIERSNWSIYTLKTHILNAEEIEDATKKIGIQLPEMIFGNNVIRISHQGFMIEFNALDALDLVVKHGNPTGGLVKVSYSNEWLKDKQFDIVKPFDWTYTTEYKGTSDARFIHSDHSIPFDKLRQHDPILFFDDVVLFEDELGDNGIAMYSVKIRVMSERLFLLARFFLRVDGVLLRVKDTRLFIEYADDPVVLKRSWLVPP